MWLFIHFCQRFHLPEVSCHEEHAEEKDKDLQKQVLQCLGDILPSCILSPQPGSAPASPSSPCTGLVLSSCSFPLSKTFTFLTSHLAPYLGGNGSTREMLSSFQAVPENPGPEGEISGKALLKLGYAQGRQNIWDKNYQTLGKTYTDVAD